MTLTLKIERITNFVKKSTIIFDESHNHEHANAVLKNALDICKSDYPNIIDKEIVTACALLHDVCDHKYPEAISRSELENFIGSEFCSEKKTRILSIIDSVSFSKQDKSSETTEERMNSVSSETTEDIDSLHLRIIRDADRIEALGEIGIRRCEQFIRRIGGTIPDDVVQHCHDKLLRLYTEFFIITKRGREIALPLHEYIENYVATTSKAPQ